MSPGITLEQVAAAIGLAAVLFIATNIDDIFILLALFANPSFRPAQVITGQMLGMALVIALSVAGALLALVIAPAYVGLLGLVPLALGIVRLVRKDKAGDDTETPAATSGALRVLAVTAITVANGADNIGVYVPMFATAGRVHVAIYAATMLALTAGLCGIAHALIQHPKLGPPIRRFARPVTPFVLIALGIYILVESHAFAIISPRALLRQTPHRTVAAPAQDLLPLRNEGDLVWLEPTLRFAAARPIAVDPRAVPRVEPEPRHDHERDEECAARAHDFAPSSPPC